MNENEGNTFPYDIDFYSFNDKSNIISIDLTAGLIAHSIHHRMFMLPLILVTYNSAAELIISLRICLRPIDFNAIVRTH